MYKRQQYILFIEPPTTFGNDVSVSILLPAIIGGAGTVLGPLIGSIIIIPLGELTTVFFGNFVGVNLMTYGLILVLVVLYLPEGIVGWFQNRKKKKELTNSLSTFNLKGGVNNDAAESRKTN